VVDFGLSELERDLGYRLARGRFTSKRIRCSHGTTKSRTKTSVPQQTRVLLYCLDRGWTQPPAQHWHSRQRKGSNRVRTVPPEIYPICGCTRSIGSLSDRCAHYISRTSRGCWQRLRTGGLCVGATYKVFVGKSIADVPALCISFQNWRKVSASTVRRDLGVLQSAIKHALEIQLITRLVIIKRPTESPARERWLKRTEAAVLVAAALGFQPIAYEIETHLPMKWKRVCCPQYDLCLFILIGLYTGRRKEAILSLRWPKIDLVHGKIDFRRDGTPETKKKRGLCTIPIRLKPHLVRARGTGHNIGHVMLWEGDAVGDIKTAFNNAVRRAYLTDVTPHTLKHTAATRLMQSERTHIRFRSFSQQVFPRC
jgi:integrase